MTSIEGSAAVVFGGASGLGEASARHLASLGANVVIADIAGDRAAELAAEIGAASEPADITDPIDVARAVDKASSADGGLRICINCAGIGTPSKLVGREGATPLDHFAPVINVNLIGSINALRLAAAAMVTNQPDQDGERGVCIQTASIAAYDGQIGQIAYAASKAGVVGLTLPAARELAKFQVRVATIAPGLFDTPLLAGLPQAARDSLGQTVPYPARLGNPSEFAHLAEQIITNHMINGEVIRLDGALRMAPR